MVIKLNGAILHKKEIINHMGAAIVSMETQKYRILNPFLALGTT